MLSRSCPLFPIHLQLGFFFVMGASTPTASANSCGSCVFRALCTSPSSGKMCCKYTRSLRSSSVVWKGEWFANQSSKSYSLINISFLKAWAVRSNFNFEIFIKYLLFVGASWDIRDREITKILWGQTVWFEFKSYFLAVWPWVGYLVSPCLSQPTHL